uniref:CAP domain-containing protein n=1 Tax=Caldicellulosiruptor sp. F32 TaxID=1214564 RepID=UPI000585C1A6
KLVSPNVVNGIFMVKKGIWDDFLINDDVFKKQKDINHLLSAFERLCYLHLNSIRSQEGKQLFRYSDKISIVARLHSQNMAKYNFFGHTDVFGQSLTDRFQKQAIAFKKIGENLAMGTKLLPFFANHLLLNSKGHRENIEGNFEYAAVGCAVDLNTDNVYYTQNFANLIYSQGSTFGR